jgi:regulator of protease activity HflC (stomatin/prohibitin superfamily)
MAEIRRYPLVRHLRAERTSYVLKYKRGAIQRAGPGLAMWFWPMTASIAEVPVDDREVPFVFHARSSDFQDVAVQGVINYRIDDPQLIAERVDFAIDLTSGLHTKQPLDTIASMLTELAQQLAWRYLARTGIREILASGRDFIRREVHEGLAAEPALADMGIVIVSVRVSSIKPTVELERALETRTRESIQQEADEATFARRALAVEKERAIAENELQSQIELATREEQLINQRGANERRRAEEETAAKRIDIEGRAEGTKVRAGAEGEAIRLVETAKLESERERMSIYAELPTPVMFGLAARELAGKLERIEHLNLTPDLFGPSLLNLINGTNKKLAGSE